MEYDQLPYFCRCDPKHLQPFCKHPTRHLELAVWLACGKSIFGEQHVQTCSGCTFRLRQDIKYSCCNICAFTKSTFLGKRTMTFTSTLCRMMLYHKITPSLTTTHCLFVPPPWDLRRSHSRWKPYFLLKYCCPRLGVLLLNFAKESLLACSATADVGCSTTADVCCFATADVCRSSSAGHVDKTRTRANL